MDIRILEIARIEIDEAIVYYKSESPGGGGRSPGEIRKYWKRGFRGLEFPEGVGISSVLLVEKMDGAFGNGW